MIKMNNLLKYLKGRAASLGAFIDYYDGIQRQGRGWLTSDQQYSYDLYVARLDEIRKLIDVIENSK